MVLIAASIFSKNGKALLARQFVTDMTKARLEGLLDAYPKLIGNDKNAAQRQHTFVETDSVRYVYHPLDNIYVVLITTKNSNILEDLETLRLFSRVIPEYCRSNEEKEILAHDFELLFAFDEIVTLGYRESVNLAQIRTFTEMDSHEERVFMQIKEAQEKAAKQAMAEKAKEFKRMQKEALSRGLKPGASSFSSATSISSSSVPLTAVSDVSSAKSAASTAPTRPSGGGKALKLGAKAKDEDAFLNQLRQQGQAIAPVEKSAIADRGSTAPLMPASTVKREAVHVRTEEKITASVSRDGGLQNAEIFGTVTLCVASPEFNTVAVKMNNSKAQSGAQLQVHPNLDKKEWQSTGLLKLKSANKPFPVSSDVGVLKWRLILQAEDELPLTLNVWPEESADGCQVNIEYTLQDKSFSLENVQIHIPLPPATAPVVSECEGSYEYLKPRNQLLWTLPSIDSSNDSGTLEFAVPNGHKDHFFPVTLSFFSERLMVPITVEHIETMDGANTDVTHSMETRLVTDKYEIV